jgi:CrcB protein
MSWNVMIVGIGGFLGAIARYAIFVVDNSFYYRYNFPFATLAINLIGSFLIGIALGLSVHYNLFNRGTISHTLFVTGFLGAFTTFSTFSQDSFMLFRDKQYWSFAINILLQVVLGISLVAAGYYLIARRA